MQKITPFLWFDADAEQAAKFYVSLFKGSKITAKTLYGAAGPMPKGTVMTVAFELAGQGFTALNGGRVFAFTPAISFFVGCETKAELDALWKKLIDGGSALMELGAYPFAERYGWVQDRYGLSWQLILGKRSQKITPCLMFVGAQTGKAGEAMERYTSLFKDSRIVQVERYTKAEAKSGGTEGGIKHAVFALAGQQFIAMDGGVAHRFAFNEAVSLVVNCETQGEIDALWKRLTAKGGEEGECGWLKDAYGVSWQVVPATLPALLDAKEPARADRVIRAIMGMRKLDIAALERAYGKK